MLDQPPSTSPSGTPSPSRPSPSRQSLIRPSLSRLSRPGATEPTRRVLLSRAAALGILVGGAVGVSAARPALAVARPDIATRADWKARPPKSVAVVLGHGPDHIVIHHTASANSTDVSQSHAFALSRSIQNLHMDTNGWADIGQQFTISRGGHLMEGRNRTLACLGAGTLVVGAQTLGHNEHTIGIENEGLYTSASPTSVLWNAPVELCAYLCDVYGLAPATAIVGHRNYVATACPGTGCTGCCRSCVRTWPPHSGRNCRRRRRRTGCPTGAPAGRRRGKRSITAPLRKPGSLVIALLPATV
jgi:N-acetylmuramoyl-L-alanine amidase-like protein